MVEAGEWRATRPEVKGHAGFRLNALVSLFSNASWAKLVEEYEKAEKNGSSDMQVFHNTVLGQVWSHAIEYVNENQLMQRREPWGIAWDADASVWREDIPEDVAYITVGVDTQPDRLECTIIGWSPNHVFFLGHHIIRGAVKFESTWDELDAFLSTRWKHPLGSTIGIDAAAVDSGDGNTTQYVYDYCEKVQQRKIVAIKGREGPIPFLQGSKSRRRNRSATLYIVGVDQVKTEILTTLPKEKGDQLSFRYAETLNIEFFEQLTSERRVIRHVNGKPKLKFERIGSRRAEGLDCTVYAIAVRRLLKLDYDRRYKELTSKPQPRTSLKDRVSKLHG